MPRYTYRCDKCEKTFQVVHSIKEKLTDCEECEPKGTLSRIPSMPYVFSKEKKAGKLVEQHIEEVKKDIAEEKVELRKAEYK